MSDPTPEEAGRIRDWIRAEAASKSLEAIRDAVSERYRVLNETVEAFAPADLASSTGEEWAPIDAYRHLVEWNWQIGEDVLHTALMGERPGNPRPTFPAEREALAARLAESAESVWAHVSAADPGAFLDLTWEHPFFGQLNWREWYFFLGVHAFDHTRQLLAMKDSPRA